MILHRVARAAGGLGCALLATFGLVGASIHPAAATVSGVVRVSKSSALDSTSAKSVTVPCPSGELVMGSGAQINIATSGKAALGSITPLPGLSGVNAVAYETGSGTTANWSLKAYAVCGVPSGGLQLVTKTTSINSSNKVATATCPTGTKVIGTGAQVSTSDPGKVVLSSIAPNNTLASVRSAAVELGSGTTNNWYLKSYAICVAPSVVPALQWIAADGTPSSNHDRAVTISCPSGKHLLDAGGELLTTGADPTHLVIDEITPISLYSVTVVGAEAVGGTSQVWNVAAYAICG